MQAGDVWVCFLRVVICVGGSFSDLTMVGCCVLLCVFCCVVLGLCGCVAEGCCSGGFGGVGERYTINM